MPKNKTHEGKLYLTMVGSDRRVRHGARRGGKASPTYKSWQAMKSRCLSPGHKDFRFYGARGVTVCQRWLTFGNFLSDLGERPPGTSLDRIDPAGNYEPGNCRWATRKVQARNKKRVLTLTVNGVTASVADWAERAGLQYDTLVYRISRLGWSPEKAVARPPQRGRWT